MCGRYTLIRLSDLTMKFPWILPANEVVQPRFNIAPSQAILVVINDGSNRLQLVRWGLIPSWADDETIGNRTINARAETLAQKPAFRTALRKRRCMIPADGFYEWRKEPDGTKTPMYIRMKDRTPFAFAGLWDDWHPPDGGAIRSCTIITTDANAVLEPIHNRMPVILGAEACRRWIDPVPAADADLKSLTDMLRPSPAEEMDATAVSRLVNSPANESPRCIEAVTEPAASEQAPSGNASTKRGASRHATRTKPPDQGKQGRLF
jgi:putative SOS response-associated peptidase YedK